MQLRQYQQRAIDQLYDWFRHNPTGNPVLNMPGGSGKSVVIASLARDALQNWPDTRVLMLVSSKELVDQNSKKLRQIWPNAPMGIVSASLGKKEFGEPITYAGIGSVAKKAWKLGRIDLCLIDEVHMCSTNDEGMYRNLIAELLVVNPNMRIVGFSASPYRLGHGMINEGPNVIFKDILEPVLIEELIYKKHLVPLRSKTTDHKLDSAGLHKRGGEFIASEMEAAYNTKEHNLALALEVADRAKDRNHWLVFCSGREHAENLADCFNKIGIAADFLVTPVAKSERERKLADFEIGKIKVLCNVGILTTGYDFPALDCIVFARSTMSPGLYLQMAVRGMRPCPEVNKQDCLVLDFAGVVAQHGPITAINPRSVTKKGEGQSEAPVKVCDNCNELVPISARTCDACGFAFPEPEAKKLKLHQDDIMGMAVNTMEVTKWWWRKHTSRTSGKDMLAVTYYGSLSDPSVTEYLPVLHDGYAGTKALRSLGELAGLSGVTLAGKPDLESVAKAMTDGEIPVEIKYKRDGKFYRVIERIWDVEATEAA
jgi:DNA repair protein RadD